MIRREIVLPAPRDEVWEALTDPTASPTGSRTTSISTCDPAAGASFRWANGEERTATVTEVEPERRLAFDVGR